MEEEKKAQAQVWRHIYGFAESMMLNCAIQLGVADILHQHGRPISLSELASALPFKSVDHDRLRRIMRYLVHMKLFASSVDGSGDGGGERYSLTPASQLLVRSREKNLASFALLQFYESDAWRDLHAAVEEGGATPWERRHGVSYRDYFARDVAANRLLSDAMTSHTSMVTEALVKGLASEGILDGGVGSLVDVGGSTGEAARAIAKAFPRVQCSVFDLPHVVANAPECPEVERIGGDMFVSVPETDVVFMKSVLHDWGDEDCVKILKKCKEAIGGKGKVVIVDIVMNDDGAEESTEDDEFAGARLGMEMDMLVTVGGKERSKEEWGRLFELAGYGRHKITPIAAIESIIQVYP